MIKAYQYIYYRVYDLISSTKIFNNRWGSINILTILECLFLLELHFFIGNPFYFNLTNSKIIIITIYVFLLLANYWLLFRNLKYKKIISKYKQEGETKRQYGRIITLSFVIGILLLLFFI